jgi:hypothetical protein
LPIIPLPFPSPAFIRDSGVCFRVSKLRVCAAVRLKCLIGCDGVNWTAPCFLRIGNRVEMNSRVADDDEQVFKRKVF